MNIYRAVRDAILVIVFLLLIYTLAAIYEWRRAK